MMKHATIIASLLCLLIVTGCATLPKGPSVMVLPPPDKPFEVFQVEDAICRQWAAQQIGMTPQETVNQNFTTSAVVGTIIGAGLGAAIGSTSGDMGSGAAIGAASGLVLGAASGSESSRMYGAEAQRRYDISYMQCMYAKGNQIPGVVTQPRSNRSMPPPPPAGSEYVPPDYSPPPPAKTR